MDDETRSLLYFYNGMSAKDQRNVDLGPLKRVLISTLIDIIKNNTNWSKEKYQEWLSDLCSFEIDHPLVLLLWQDHPQSKTLLQELKLGEQGSDLKNNMYYLTGRHVRWMENLECVASRWFRQEFFDGQEDARHEHRELFDIAVTQCRGIGLISALCNVVRDYI